MVNQFAKKYDVASIPVQLKVAEEESVWVHDLYSGKEQELHKLWVTKDEAKNVYAKKTYKVKNSICQVGSKGDMYMKMHEEATHMY